MNFRKLLQREVLAVSRHLRDVVNDEEYHGNLQALLPSVVRKQHEAEIKATVIGHLMQIEGIGPVLAERLYDEFGSLEAIVQATPERLMLVEGIGEVRLQTIPEDVRVLMRKLRSQ
jgi:ERCC4-type nuclease